MSASAVAYFANSPRSGPAYTHSVNNVTLCKASLSYLFLLFFQRATWVGHTPTVRNFVYFRPTEHLLLSFTFKWRCLRFCNRISLKSHCRYSVIPGKRLSLISDRALNVVKCRTRGQAARQTSSNMIVHCSAYLHLLGGNENVCRQQKDRSKRTLNVCDRSEESGPSKFPQGVTSEEAASSVSEFQWAGARDNIDRWRVWGDIVAVDAGMTQTCHRETLKISLYGQSLGFWDHCSCVNSSLKRIHFLRIRWFCLWDRREVLQSLRKALR